ncbi:iron chaperone [Chryseolinea soli]|uniref:YdhG-like domain-containing protein n=1 Tax=Chryseolinea soli TaxID=2321403 RepID=A0A385SXW8_9BACT|nr:DUF1801 domain-containing protein [Chryseolinea soli]AYB35516.1 hypothetical protein D4L85_12560 [Chryseolinea soli]
MKTGIKTADEYLDGLPEDVQVTLEKLRRSIRAAAPKAEEIIRYGIVVFRQGDWLVGFGAFKNHCGFYVMSNSVLKRFEKEVAGYEKATGTIRFPLDKALPAALVKSIVKARMEENEAARVLKEAKASAKKRTAKTSARKKGAKAQK